MTSQVNDPEQLFARQLGEMLGAENTFLAGMREMEAKAQNEDLRRSIQAHIQQTQTQVENVRKAFQALGMDPVEVDCPAAKGFVESFRRNASEIQTGGATEMKNLSHTLVDNVTMMSAANVEHFEIGAYRGLIATAEKLGKRDLVPILQENLRMEETQAKQVEDMMQRMP